MRASLTPDPYHIASPPSANAAEAVPARFPTSVPPYRTARGGGRRFDERIEAERFRDARACVRKPTKWPARSATAPMSQGIHEGMSERRSQFAYEDLLACGRGDLFGA